MVMVLSMPVMPTPGHQMMTDCINGIKPREEGEDGWAIIGRTGPGLLTDKVYQHLRRDKEQKGTDTVVLPPGYFFPFHSGSKDDAKDDPRVVEEFRCPWSIGEHLWNLSWD
ncbi:MAG: hypothetical protein ACQEP8_02985 [Chlamydiota bacterium]